MLSKCPQKKDAALLHDVHKTFWQILTEDRSTSDFTDYHSFVNVFSACFLTLVVRFVWLPGAGWGQLGWYWTGCATPNQQALTDNHFFYDSSCFFAFSNILYCFGLLSSMLLYVPVFAVFSLLTSPRFSCFRHIQSDEKQLHKTLTAFY